jgi:hypothetical protein
MSWTTILHKFGFSWSLAHVFYVLDWRTMSPQDVKVFLNRNVNTAFRWVHKNNIYNIPKFSGSRDKIVMDVFKWVVKEITYMTDIQKFGVVERWEDIDNVIQTKNADCESMVALMYSVCRAYDINPLQIKLVTGDVKEGGHCWMEYYPDYCFENNINKWVIFDPAYDPKNILWYDKRLDAREDSRYLSIWWEVNDLIIQ